jgi:hypothetical protein
MAVVEETVNMLSNHVIELCTSGHNVSSLVAENPTLPPGDAWGKLHGHHAFPPRLQTEDEGVKTTVESNGLEKALQCGKWGLTKPSDLFLKVMLKIRPSNRV